MTKCQRSLEKCATRLIITISGPDEDDDCKYNMEALFSINWIPAGL